ncbi:hypothetical protein QA600_18050 [Natronococcus sp. A-GB1]|uniref:hypothetical protein n=1 Tax=Natronococcus sp. A-GB1 TaxID=3037648 RepID=UPI00241C0426|nr:hypothetical protein [Natronococcus sp. A-GB1]MDG5761235.1 hypothetical protein [Natronococcus sp. A-GB1]
MPVDIESDCWDKSKRADCIEVEIERYLQENAEKAYRPAEVTGYLTDEKPEVFPQTLLGGKDSARASRIALVTSRLEKLAWHERVEAHVLDDKLYYTNREGGQFPVAEVERNIPNRLIDLEQKIEEIDTEITDVLMIVQHLEAQLHEEFDLR